MDTHNVHMSITQETSLSNHVWYLYACGIGKQPTVLMPWALDTWPWDVQKDPVDHLNCPKIELPLHNKQTMCQPACHMVHTFLGVHCSMETGNGPM